MVAAKLTRQSGWLCATSFIAVFLIGAISGHVAQADDKGGEKLFSNNCAACHAGGKNIIDPKKPVIGSKKLASKASFKSFIEVPNGTMPAFKAIADKDTDLTALYNYVKGLK